jgi:hypothetical protein
LTALSIFAEECYKCLRIAVEKRGFAPIQGAARKPRPGHCDKLGWLAMPAKPRIGFLVLLFVTDLAQLTAGNSWGERE